MAIVERNGTSIWWEATGSGEPVLLVNGLSSTSDMWYRLLPHLEPRYRVIRFDNRGVGRTGVPATAFSIDDMAGDAAAVISAAGERSAHMLGLSMGGLIAQELAVTSTPVVRSLILAATHPGMARAVPADDAMTTLAGGAAMTPEQLQRAMVPFTFSPTTPQERIDEDLAVRQQMPTDPAGYAAQLAAAAGFDRYDDLASLTVPTLVLHGAVDRLVPPGNAKLLADAIPGARLLVLEDASHQLFTDQELEAARSVLGFLDGLAAR